MFNATLTLPERLRNDLRNAMKERDAVATMTLRSLLGAFDNASAVPMTTEHLPVYGRSGDVPRKVVAENDYQDIVRREALARRSTALEFERLGRGEAAARLEAELSIILRSIDL